MKRVSKERKEKGTPKGMGEEYMKKGVYQTLQGGEEKEKNQVAPNERVIIHINDCKRGEKREKGKSRMSLLRGSMRIW